MKSVRRLWFVFAVPLTVILSRVWWENYGAGGGRVVTYLLLSLLEVAIYPLTFSWFSVWIGMKSRARARATVSAMTAMVIWFALPLGVPS